MRVIVLQGVSGSGKSTYGRSLVQNHVGTVAVVSADDFFVRLGGGTYQFDARRLSEAHGACFRDFLGHLQSGTDLVVVDNTSTTAVEVSPYMLAAQAFGYVAEIHRVVCEPAVAAARNLHNVSESTVRRMAERIASERLPPWWTVVEVNNG